jgi:acyl carrier protein
MSSLNACTVSRRQRRARRHRETYGSLPVSIEKAGSSGKQIISERMDKKMEFEKLRDIIVEVLQIEPDKVTVDTAFEDLDADSLDVYQIISAIGSEFDIEISDEDAESITTVGDALEKIKDAVN